MHHVILIIVMRLLHSQSHILLCLDCIQRHYCSRVKTVNLFVWHFIVLYLLPEGSSSESLCPGCDGSLVMFWAFLRHLALYSSSREGREQPVIFLAVFMTLWSAFLSAAVQLTYHTHTHAVCQHTLYWAAMEWHKRFFATGGSFWGVSESKVSAVPFWWSLRCSHSTTGLPRSGCPGTWS